MDTKRRLEYDITYMNMASCMRELSFATRSKVGCIIVSDDDQIIAQGYNGMPKGFPNECEHLDENGNLVTNDEVLHAESNAIAKCAKCSEGKCKGATAYVSLSPCLQCSKLIIQSGIKRVVFREEYRDITPLILLLKGGIEVQMLDTLHKELIEYTFDKEVGTLYKDYYAYLTV